MISNAGKFRNHIFNPPEEGLKAKKGLSPGIIHWKMENVHGGSCDVNFGPADMADSECLEGQEGDVQRVA